MSAAPLLVGSELTVVIAFSAVVAFAVALTALLAALVIEVAGEGDDVSGDVQRFLELAVAAHSSLPDGPLLSDPHGETTAAIGQLLAKKDEARKALWASRDTARARRKATRSLIRAHTDTPGTAAAHEGLLGGLTGGPTRPAV